MAWLRTRWSTQPLVGRQGVITLIHGRWSSASGLRPRRLFVPLHTCVLHKWWKKIHGVTKLPPCYLKQAVMRSGRVSRLAIAWTWLRALAPVPKTVQSPMCLEITWLNRGNPVSQKKGSTPITTITIGSSRRASTRRILPHLPVRVIRGRPELLPAIVIRICI